MNKRFSPAVMAILMIAATWVVASIPASSQTSSGEGEVLLYSLPDTHYEPLLRITGMAEPDQPIRVELNQNTVAWTQTNGSGDFAAQVQLQPGSNELRVWGDETRVPPPSSVAQNVFYRPTSAPSLNATSATATTAGPPAPVLDVPPSTTADNPLSISGSVSVGGAVSFYVNGRYTRTVDVATGGNFAAWVPLEDGANSVYAVISDGTGQSPVSNTVDTVYTNQLSRSQSGTVVADTVWTAGDGTPYSIDGHLVVDSGATLWIQPGVQVNVSGSYKLTVQGELVVSGSALEPVVLRPISSACDGVSVRRQDWQGIEIQVGASANVEYAEIHCASNGLHFDGGDGSVRHSKLLNNLVGIRMLAASPTARIAPQVTAENEVRGSLYGLHVGINSAPVVSGGNEITDNHRGLYVYGNHDAAQNPAPVVTGNRLYGNSSDNYFADYFGDSAATVLDASGNWWGTVDPASIAAGIRDWNDDPGDAPVVDYHGYLDGPGGAPVYVGETLNGPIASDRTLSATEYLLLGHVTVASGATLTLDAGTQLNVPGNYTLTVQGGLVVAGSVSQPVVLRPTASACDGVSTQRQDWRGIEVQAGATASIEYAEIHCANKGVYFDGGDGAVQHSKLLNNYTAIQMSAASPETQIAPQIVAGNEIRGSNYGLYVGINSAPLVSGGNEIAGNHRGIYVYGNRNAAHNPAPVVTGNRLYNNSSDSYFADYFGNSASTVLDATGNWWGSTDPASIATDIRDWSDDSGDAPVVDYSHYLDGPGGAPAYVGETLNGPITADRTLLATEYLLLGQVVVASGTTLTLEAGTQLNVSGNYKLTVQGSLVTVGSASQPVVLRPTALACDGVSTKRQDWMGIEVQAGATVDIEYTEIHCAYRGVYLNGGDGTIQHSRLLNNNTGIQMSAASPQTQIAPQITMGNEIRGSDYGLHVGINSAPVVSGGNEITGNNRGIYVYGNRNAAHNPAPVVTGNRLYGNVSDNYFSDYFGDASSTVLDATGNWWGTVDPASIAADIRDWSDDSTDAPVVNYHGYLDGPDGAPVYTGETLNGPIAVDRTLSASEYLLLGQVTVASGATLTLGAGAQLNVPGNYKLTVQGGLVVTGTASQPVVLRPTASACDGVSTKRQDWLGIEVQAGAAADIEYAEIHCANRGVYFNGGDGAVRHSKLLNNYTGIQMSAASPAAKIAPQITSGNEIRGGQYGLHIGINSAPVVTGSNEVTGNFRGIHVYGNRNPDHNPAPVVTGNWLYGNDSVDYYTDYFGDSASTVLDATGNWWGTVDPASIAADINDWSDDPTDAPVVDYRSYLDGPDGAPVYTGETLNGPIAADRTLSSTEYLLLGHVTVAPGATLTLSPGTQLNVPGNYKLKVQGGLVAAGSATQPAVLRPSTSACDGVSTRRQDWQGIEVVAGATASLDYVEIHCANRGLYFNGGDGTVRHSRLLNNYTGIQMSAASPASQIAPQITEANEIRGSNDGLYVGINSAPLVSGGNEITGNYRGIYVYGNANVANNPAPVVTGNQLYGNSGEDYHANYFGDSASTVLDATGNWWGSVNPANIAASVRDWNDDPSDAPVVDYGSYLDGPGGAPVYAGESVQGVILADRTLPAGEHQMLGNVVVSPGVTLTLAAGARLDVVPGQKLQVAGTLIVQGDMANRVVFGSTAPTPAKGDWYGIEVTETGVLDMQHARIEYASYGVDFDGGEGTIQQSLFRHNTYGIYVRAGSSPQITNGNEITANNYGIYVRGNEAEAQNPAPVVHGSNIHANQNYNVYASYFGNPAAAVLDATGNWWGSNDPAVIVTTIYTGHETSPNVDYGSFLSAPNGELAVVVSDVQLSASQIQPLDGESAQGVFTVSRPATVTVQIRRERDNALLYTDSNAIATAGQHAFSWNGKDSQGENVGPGLYRVVLIADDGRDPYLFDAFAPSGVGSVAGSVPSRYAAYKNEFYRISVTMTYPGLLSMQVTPSGENAFYAFQDVYYEAGQHWLHWDGRRPDGSIVDGPVSIYYPAPARVRPTAIHVLDDAPIVTGPGAAPDIEVKADPYLISHSYEQVTRMAYRISQEAYVRFVLLPPGVADPNDPSAIVLVDDQLLQANDAGGNPLDHVVEWRGYDTQGAGGQPTSVNQVLVSEEGAYTFAIQARSAENQSASLYRGVVNLYR
ncbi:FlgD immunoglobulin-like domain containing protein [Marilutibacter maris]|uniref:FlgD immunoglobulin-like domain containing protein n=1 Tax=Marilutibacter maris TaxID=1605891 RepID=UPI00167DFAF2|nr:FlgD immunoglobulin-like domain containing protein [Lysobacter maris]